MTERPISTKTYKLNNGIDFPAVGLGTWQGNVGSEDEALLEESIIHALKSGYRLLDTAQSYGVEHVVGRAVKASGIPRSEIIVVTKFGANLHHDPATALEISLKQTGLDYVDVFLMHWPWATTPAPENKPLRKYDSPTFIETWKLMEPLVGPKCKSIGVSNFPEKILEELLTQATIVPAINQVELHAFNPNLKLVPYCQSKGIHVMSWSTLGGMRTNAASQALTHPLFKAIADKHGCSTGVVSLSWAVQNGTTVIPKSSSKARIEENLRLVTLRDEEIAEINQAHKTIAEYRIADHIEFLQVVVDGKQTLQGWSKVDFGWEDEEGNWLT